MGSLTSRARTLQAFSIKYCRIQIGKKIKKHKKYKNSTQETDINKKNKKTT